MGDSRRWILVLGASSGFGAATCRAFAAAGWDVFGVHLDRKSTLPAAEAVVADVRAAGRSCHFFNVNAADHDARSEVLAGIQSILENEGGRVEVLLHSLAFGSLLPFVDAEGGKTLRPRQITMTVEVMGHSLVWWARDLVAAGQLVDGGRIFAMTSAGSRRSWSSYGAVSAAKAALEAHIRQLALELADRKVTANAILAGVTETPALARIPGHESIVEHAKRVNPSGRLTQPEDVAQCLLELVRPGTYWLTGNVLQVDGGEEICS